ncbi:hypothetical protein GCM10027565_06190 [Bordetella tumulicola]
MARYTHFVPRYALRIRYGTAWGSARRATCFRYAVQAKPLRPALRPVKHLRWREARVFKAAYGQGNRILERLGSHEDD